MMLTCTDTHHLRLASWLATVVWWQQVIMCFHSFFFCDPAMRESLVHHGLTALGMFWTGVAYTLSALLFKDRLISLEQAALLDFGVKRSTKLLIWPYSILAVVFGVCFFTKLIPVEINTSVMLTTLAFVSVISVRRVFQISRQAHAAAAQAAEHAPPQRARRAKEAADALRTQSWGALAAAAGGLFFMSAQFFVLWPLIQDADRGSTLYQATTVYYAVAATFQASSGSFFALAFSGALTGAARGALMKAAAQRKRVERWRASAKSWRKAMAKAGEGGEEWQDKVRELAGRGISLDALLKVYRSLKEPGMFPDYDPAKHTTRDVVKGCLIPWSASRGCACSDIMMEGKYTRPEKMVTHNWGNLFRDLIAAIAADALGDGDFSTIAFLLERDVERLEQWVAKRNVGSRTYWVCAFSVNQHTSTCKEPCNCGMAKAVNDTPPLMPDGKSIPCEMNKFGDMMKYLSARNPRFEQIVAVDTAFKLFTRAWCIAELAAANTAGMPQSLKVTSADAMENNSESLRKLRVQDMSATRPEDKKEILDSIPDVDKFNQVLQRLLFEEILPAWTGLDGGEQMSAAGVLIRIHAVSETCHSSLVWSHGV